LNVAGARDAAFACISAPKTSLKWMMKKRRLPPGRETASDAGSVSSDVRTWPLRWSLSPAMKSMKTIAIVPPLTVAIVPRSCGERGVMNEKTFPAGAGNDEQGNIKDVPRGSGER